MAMWIGLVFGLAFAFLAIKIGFFEVWALLFNIVVSIYLAVFLGPTVARLVGLADTPYSTALGVFATGAGAFVILQGTTFILITGQYSITFVKLVDTVVAGVVGFLAGLLVWSFVAVLIAATPFAQQEYVQKLGLGRPRASVSYVAFWGNIVNAIAGSQEGYDTRKAIKALIESAQQAAAKRLERSARPGGLATPAAPAAGKPAKSELELLGPPPEMELGDI